MDTVKSQVLYDDGSHKFIFLGWEEKEESGVIQTNQYLIIDGNEGLLLDPGGVHVFPRVLANVSEQISMDKVKYIFFTHQDPDVSSGVSLWLASTPAKVYISGLWIRFLPHFGIYNTARVSPIPDRGMDIKFSSGNHVTAVPSHFMHSVGNFSLYDPIAKILFTGDIGAAVFPEGKRYPFVEDFDSHRKYMETFHKRYMGSHEICKKWSERVRKYDVKIIAPQHGAIFKDEKVDIFLDWLSGLKCGIDSADEIWGK